MTANHTLPTGSGPTQQRPFNRCTRTMAKTMPDFLPESAKRSWADLGKATTTAAVAFDPDSAATGQMSWRLFGLIPVVSAIGPDITRSAEGRLALSLPRWAKPDKRPFQLHTFGVMCSDEFTADGYTLPRTIRAGWWPDTPQWEEGEFFRATIDQGRFF